MYVCMYDSRVKIMQDDTLSQLMSTMDIATKENLENLVKVGQELLKKPVSRVNLENGEMEPAGTVTNGDALIRYTHNLTFWLSV